MRAVTWQGRRNVAVENVPDPRIEQPTDAIVEVTSTAICGSDLHLYEVLGAYMSRVTCSATNRSEWWSRRDRRSPPSPWVTAW